jgi:hypothetical protein
MIYLQNFPVILSQMGQKSIGWTDMSKFQLNWVVSVAIVVTGEGAWDTESG